MIKLYRNYIYPLHKIISSHVSSMYNVGTPAPPPPPPSELAIRNCVHVQIFKVVSYKLYEKVLLPDQNFLVTSSISSQVAVQQLQLSYNDWKEDHHMLTLCRTSYLKHQLKQTPIYEPVTKCETDDQNYMYYQNVKENTLLCK